MSAPSDARPPSPPRSPEGDDKAIPSIETANAPQLQTPPGPPMMPAPADECAYDPYGDPGLYHTSAQQAYYAPDPYARYHHQYQTPPPAPYAEAGIQTRSGRALRSPQSPRRPAGARRAQSPKKRPPKKRAGKGKPGGPQIDQPLSVLTKDYTAPVRDMAAWVNRPASDRYKEAEKKNGYIARPMNSFMLYRSAYSERVKQFCKENNHQVVSQVTGASWPLEPESIRKEYERLSILERDNHAAAHPDYKFAPNKNGKKRARADDDDDDSDCEWGGSTRTKRSRTAMSSRYGDSRSNTGTPVDDRYYAASYSPGPAYHMQYNPSSYHHQYPGRIAPVYQQGPYPDFLQPRISQYGPNVEDIHYDRYQHQMMAQQQPPAVVGMPSIDHQAMLESEVEAVGVGMVDPRLGGGNYELQPGYGPAAPEAPHPGEATLTDGWSQGAHAGAEFDQEFEHMAYL